MARTPRNRLSGLSWTELDQPLSRTTHPPSLPGPEVSLHASPAMCPQERFAPAWYSGCCVMYHLVSITCIAINVHVHANILSRIYTYAYISLLDSLFSCVSLFQDVVSGRHRAGKLGLGGAVGRHDPNSPHEGGGCRRVSTCWVIRLSPVPVIVVVEVVKHSCKKNNEIGRASCRERV